MQVFDASSMIYAWDNYPVEQFPPLWNWIQEEIQKSNFTIAKVAFTEVKTKSPDCGAWLDNNNIIQLTITNEVVQEALRIKNLIGVMNDDYHPKGVGENDLLIIATALVHQAQLISDEAKQRTLPTERTKMKIPAVCNLYQVGVPCISFIELLKTSKRVFQ